ncbi:MAG: efflux RND transporter periplasmic adaptor subunit [Spirochaetes bacterium]|nr:efflux RND transporter periplasmic adaptor subunit [Spirochaetota bacterium]
MRKKNKIILAAAGIITILALVAISVYFRLNAESRQTQARGRGGPTIFAVESARSQKGELADHIRINGNVMPVRNIDIFPDIAGKLSRLPVALGDRVTAGQVIAEIDPSRPGLSFALSPVRSTITGTVTSLPHEVGATISLATAVATVGDLTRLQIRTEVPEAHVGNIGIGTRANVSFVAWPGRIFTTRIVEISPVVSNITRTISVRLEFDRIYPELKAGMFASITMFTETRSDIIIVPAAAAVIREGGRFIFVIEDDKVIMTPVTIGLTVDGMTEITSGISEGVEIVVRGQNLLDDGAMVNVLNRPGTNGGSD